MNTTTTKRSRFTATKKGVIQAGEELTDGQVIWRKLAIDAGELAKPLEPPFSVCTPLVPVRLRPRHSSDMLLVGSDRECGFLVWGR